MLDEFDGARMGHVAGLRRKGDAAGRVLTAAGFAGAAEEIAGWEGYAPTPLLALDALAGALGVAKVLYKDEGQRFGLGSFKALGGAYAALRVLQREVSRALGRPVAPADIRKGRHTELVSRIMLVTATDGNHGRALAWGCRRFGAPCRIYIHAEVSEARAAAMRALGAEVLRIDGNYVRFGGAGARGGGGQRLVRGLGHLLAGLHGGAARRDGGLWRHGEGGLRCARPGADPCLPAGGRGRAGRRPGRGSPAALERRVAAHRRRGAPNSPPCLFESARAGDRTDIRIEEETLMAGLSCGEPSGLAWEVLAEEASDFLTVPESFVGPAMRLLARPFGGDPEIEAGESAVAGLAALIAAARSDRLRRALGPRCGLPRAADRLRRRHRPGQLRRARGPRARAVDPSFRFAGPACRVAAGGEGAVPAVKLNGEERAMLAGEMGAPPALGRRAYGRGRAHVRCGGLRARGPGAHDGRHGIAGRGGRGVPGGARRPSAGGTPRAGAHADRPRAASISPTTGRSARPRKWRTSNGAPSPPAWTSAS